MTAEVDLLHEYIQANAEVKAVNAELKAALRENTDLAVENARLKFELERSNVDYLKLKQGLSARGAMELMESQRYGRIPAELRTHWEKFEYIFEKDTSFAAKAASIFERNISQKEVGKLAESLYTAACEDVHAHLSFDSKVAVRRCGYQPDQLKLLQAICATLPLPLEIV